MNEKNSCRLWQVGPRLGVSPVHCHQLSCSWGPCCGHAQWAEWACPALTSSPGLAPPAPFWVSLFTNLDGLRFSLALVLTQ